MRIENHCLTSSDVEYQCLFRTRTSTVDVYIDDAVHKTPKGLSLLRRYYSLSFIKNLGSIHSYACRDVFYAIHIVTWMARAFLGNDL
jgi:hypothetical protein